MFNSSGGGGDRDIFHSIEMAVDKQYGGAEIRGRSGFGGGSSIEGGGS